MARRPSPKSLTVSVPRYTYRRAHIPSSELDPSGRVTVDDCHFARANVAKEPRTTILPSDRAPAQWIFLEAMFHWNLSLFLMGIQECVERKRGSRNNRVTAGGGNATASRIAVCTILITRRSRQKRHIRTSVNTDRITQAMIQELLIWRHSLLGMRSSPGEEPSLWELAM